MSVLLIHIILHIHQVVLPCNLDWIRGCCSHSFEWYILLHFVHIFGCFYSGQRMIPTSPPRIKYLLCCFVGIFVIVNGNFHVSIWIQPVSIPQFSILLYELLCYSDCAFAVEESQTGKASTTSEGLSMKLFISYVRQ